MLRRVPYSWDVCSPTTEDGFGISMTSYETSEPTHFEIMFKTSFRRVPDSTHSQSQPMVKFFRDSFHVAFISGIYGAKALIDARSCGPTPALMSFRGLYQQVCFSPASTRSHCAPQGLQSAAAPLVPSRGAARPARSVPCTWPSYVLRAARPSAVSRVSSSTKAPHCRKVAFVWKVGLSHFILHGSCMPCILSRVRSSFFNIEYHFSLDGNPTFQW